MELSVKCRIGVETSEGDGWESYQELRDFVSGVHEVPTLPFPLPSLYMLGFYP